MNEQSPVKKIKYFDLEKKFESNRQQTAENILLYDFNIKRVKNLQKPNNIQEGSKGILYWMFRDVRVQDNWAMLYAQRLALQNRLPLHVCFCIMPAFLDAGLRYYKFLIKGLKEVENDCKGLNIQFHLLQDNPGSVVLEFVNKYKMGAVIADFCPLKLPMNWFAYLEDNLPEDVPIYLVDAHNVLPCWFVSEKAEHAARTIRGKIHSKLEEFLTEFPPVVMHQYTTKQKFKKNDWKRALQNVTASMPVKEITWAKPGYKHGIKELERFIENRLEKYEHGRNDPLSNATSNLSPWFNFGMISVQRCILEIINYKQLYPESVKSFIEEAIVRRELSDNFCYYNENYDNLKGAANWAIKTLNDHRKDVRPYTYSLTEFEDAVTHDDLWNACQNQLKDTGKMHGYLRMYWAKKLLEWSCKPEWALEWANYLNNKYSIDGCSPNGYVGCMWSICGIHDRAWAERTVFGKIRYMNRKGCERKFDVKEFIKKWGKGGSV